MIPHAKIKNDQPAGAPAASMSGAPTTASTPLKTSNPSTRLDRVIPVVGRIGYFIGVPTTEP